MSELSKQALKVDNNQSFPNNSTGYITPAILRTFNDNVIDSVVVEETYQPFTQSVLQSLDALDAFTASLNTSFDALDAFTASAQISINALNATTQSINASITQLNAFTASQSSINGGYNTFTQSVVVSIGRLNDSTASLNSFSASAQISINALNTSASLALVNASFNNGTRNLTFTKGDTTTFSVNIPDASGSTLPSGVVSGSTQITALGFLQTSSFNAYTSSNNSKWSTLGGLTGSYATTGSNTFTGQQKFTQAITASVITVTTGSFGNGINIFQDGLSQIRFYSGSTTTQVGTWVNLQSNPANGALAISSFPSNNHFVDFDVNVTQSVFTAPISGMGGTLKVANNMSLQNGNLNVTGSLLISGAFNAIVSAPGTDSINNLFTYGGFTGNNSVYYSTANIDLIDFAGSGLNHAFQIAYANNDYNYFSALKVGESDFGYFLGDGNYDYDFSNIQLKDNGDQTTTAIVKADFIQMTGSVGVTNTLNINSGSYNGQAINNITPVSSSQAAIQNIVTLTAYEFSAITPISSTLYIII